MPGSSTRYLLADAPAAQVPKGSVGLHRPARRTTLMLPAPSSSGVPANVFVAARAGLLALAPPSLRTCFPQPSRRSPFLAVTISLRVMAGVQVFWVGSIAADERA